MGERGGRDSYESPPPGPNLEQTTHRITTSVGSGGALAGGTRICVACSNAYARAIKRGSLNARPENVTPAGPGFALKPGGNAALTMLSKNPPGTTMLG